MEQIAADLIKVIDQAPEWRPDWPVHTPLPDPPVNARLPRF
jgi:hypothetical protein